MAHLQRCHCLEDGGRATLAGMPVPVLALGGSDCEALHAGALGQPVNSLSSLAYVAAAAYVVRRGGPPGPALALALVGVGSVLYHGPMPPGAELVHDASLATVPVAGLAVATRRRTFPRPPALALAALAAGAVANVLSRTGAPLCRPDSLLQGHAVWHVLTAAGAALWLARWPRSDSRTGDSRGVHGLTTVPGSDQPPPTGDSRQAIDLTTVPGSDQLAEGEDDSAGMTSAP